MKWITRTLYLITVSFLLIACDPGMTIRQIKASSGNSAPLRIEVKTQHPLVGQTWYHPRVAITNTLDSAISITSVELVTKAGTYADKRTESYPLAVLAGKTETLDTLFDLTADVKKTLFRRPAELRVHYRSHGRDETTHVSVIGGPLDTGAP